MTLVPCRNPACFCNTRYISSCKESFDKVEQKYARFGAACRLYSDMEVANESLKDMCCSSTAHICTVG